MGIINNIKLRLKTSKVMALNKPIEVMTVEEMSLEYSKRLKNIDKTNVKDDRFFEIAEVLLKRENREKNLKQNIITGTFSQAHNYETRKMILENLSGYIEEDNVFHLCNEIERINHVENNSEPRGIKKAINNVYRRFFPLNEEIQREERKRMMDKNLKENDSYRNIIYSKNLDKINIGEIMDYHNYDRFLKIYNLLSDEQKIDVLFSNGMMYFDDSKIPEIAANLPVDLAKKKYLQKEFIAKKFEEIFIGEKITVDDIKDFYRKNGVLPSYGARECLFQDDSVYSSEEFIKEVNYLTNENDKKMLFMYLGKGITLEERQKMLNSEEISDELRKSVFASILNELDNVQKIELFKTMNNEEKIQYERFFTQVYIGKDKSEDVAKEYMNTILNNINDTHLKERYLILFFRNNIYEDKDVIFELLKKKEHNSLVGILTLKHFSEEQIREIFDSADSVTRTNMIDLSYFNFWDESMESFEQLFERVNNKESFILVKPDNYVDFLYNSKSAEELKKLSRMMEFKDCLKKEDILNLQDTFKKYNLEKEYYQYIVYQSKDKIGFDGLRQIMTNAKELDDEIIYNMPKTMISTDTYREELLKALEIQNMEYRIRYMSGLTGAYIYSNTPEEKHDIFGIFEPDNTEVLNILESLIKSNEVNAKDKYSFLQIYLDKANIFAYDLETMKIRDENKPKIEKFNGLFKYINSINDKEMYNNMFCNDGRFNHDLVANLGSDLVYEKLTKLYENNHSVIDYMSRKLLNDECLKTLDEDLIEYLSRYGGGRSLSEVFKSSSKVNLIIDLYKKLKTLEAFPEDDMDLVISKLERLSEENIKEHDLCNPEQHDKLLTLMFNYYYNDYSDVGYFDVFDNRIKTDCMEKIRNSLSSRQEMLDSFGKRFLSMSYDNMKDLAIKYGEDIEFFIKKYEDKNELSLEERNELSAMKTVRNIKEILNIKDKDAIRQAYMELDKDESLQDIIFEPIISLNENVKRVYNKDYLKDLYVPNENDKKMINGAEVYSPKEFNMFIHVIGAYSAFNLVDNSEEKKSADEIWESKENKQSHILCTVYSRNNNMAFVKNLNKQSEDHSVKLGFADIGNNAITMSNTTDLASNTMHITSQRANRYITFRSADNLIDGTRSLYNEVDIERRIENDKSHNIQPSYVICFDTINEESKKVAKDFKIPIVYIDREEIAKQESEKLSQVISEYEKTKNPELLSKIIVQYQSNCNGLYVEREDLIEKYFNADTMNQKVKSIIDGLNDECKNGNKKLGIAGLVALNTAMEDEFNKYKYSNSDRVLDDEKMLKIKEFGFETKTILGNEKVSVRNKNRLSERLTVKGNQPDEKDMLYNKISDIKKELDNERE